MAIGEIIIPFSFAFGLKMQVKDNVIEHLTITYYLPNALAEGSYSVGEKVVY